MSEQYLITLDEWKPKRFSLPITNTTLVKYGKLGYIVPRPQKIRGRWLIDRRAVFVGPGETGIAPEIHTGDDDALKEILTHVTEATKNSTDVAGLYEKFDRRTGRVYYQYKNPVTGKFHGLGTDKGKAEKIASTANQRIAAAEAEYFMRKIDESLSATKRRGIRLKAWVDRYLKIQDTRLKNGDIAATTHKEKTRMAAYLVSRLGNHPLKELEVRDFALILDEWLDKDMVSTARVNRGLWVDIYKEAQHAGKFLLDGILRRLPVNRS